MLFSYNYFQKRNGVFTLVEFKNNGLVLLLTLSPVMAGFLAKMKIGCPTDGQ